MEFKTYYHKTLCGLKYVHIILSGECTPGDDLPSAKGMSSKELERGVVFDAAWAVPLWTVAALVADFSQNPSTSWIGIYDHNLSAVVVICSKVSVLQIGDVIKTDLNNLEESNWS